MSFQTAPCEDPTPRWDRLELLLKIAEGDRTRFCLAKYFTDKMGPEDYWPTNKEALPIDREDWCNTAACFAGHALCEWENPFWITGSSGEVMIDTFPSGDQLSEEAAQLLGLDDDRAFWLFCAFADACFSTEGGEVKCMEDLLHEYKRKRAKSTDDIAIEYLRAACENKEFERPDEFLRRRLSE